MWLPAPGRLLAFEGCWQDPGARRTLDAPREGLLSGAGSARGERSEVALGEAAVLAVLLEHHAQNSATACVSSPRPAPVRRYEARRARRQSLPEGRGVPAPACRRGGPPPPRRR